MRFGPLLFALFLAVSIGLAEENLFQPSVRSPRLGEVIYFLLPDRFENGDPTNNTGRSPSSDPNVNGFDPSNPNFFHGGDLKGITDKLDYIHDLGATSIWTTPILRNRPVQDYGEKRIAGYHGYWVLDFTDVDRHFGTKADFQRLISSANDRGIGIIMDVVVNHTANVIQPKNGVYAYQYKFSKPYRDANGKPFDDRDYINREDFPKLDPDISFPIPPTFANDKDRHIKVPDWLNDPTVYHNRGEASSSGESALYGNISGLDDLFTEQLRVVRGMIEIYSNWIRDFDITGFRLDTVKHVNNEFWQSFVPAIRQNARKDGRKDFLVFGEVFDQDPAFISEFVHRAAMPSVLDFGFQRIARGFASGIDAPVKLADFYAKDGFYTTPSANAYGLVTFLGNHDLGRIGHFLSDDLGSASSEELLARDVLAHALMLFTRGVPVIYYGDEQGFTGKGGDVAAREDMFASKVADYAAETRIGGGDPSVAAFNEKHPLYRAIQEMIRIRKQNPALSRGIQTVRYADSEPGIFAVSRVDRDSRQELLVLFNNSGQSKTALVKDRSSNANWEQIYSTTGGADIKFGQAASLSNRLAVTLPSISCVVLRNLNPIEGTPSMGELRLEANRTSEIDERWEIKAEETADEIVSIAFGVRIKGETNYRLLGTADSAPYRIFPTWDEVPNAPDLEFEAVSQDLSGHETTAECAWHRPGGRRGRE
jgi:glycosidase